MKIALYSDLHLECLPEPWQPPILDADVVILAGDIASHTHGLKWASTIFSHWPRPPAIFYIPGNHEYYGAHLGLLAELRKPEWQLAGVRLLEKDCAVLPGLRILGCTLWSGFDLYGPIHMDVGMNEAKRSINDYPFRAVPFVPSKSIPSRGQKRMICFRSCKDVSSTKPGELI